MKRQPNEWNYEKYLNSMSWKCDKSLVGAHYWIVIGDRMKCMHCSKEQLVPKIISVRGNYQLVSQD